MFGNPSTPHVDRLTPPLVVNDVSTTLHLSGTGLLAPAVLHLVHRQATYTMPLDLVSSAEAHTVLPSGIHAGNYAVYLINGDGVVVEAPSIGIYPPHEGCFSEEFGSGLGQWQSTDPWGLTTLPMRADVLDDSPGQPYPQAVVPGTLLTRTVTLDTALPLTSCPFPVLTLVHDYVFAAGDSGHVEVSYDSGATWERVALFYGSAHPSVHTRTQDREWQTAHLQPTQIQLFPRRHATAMRLRLQIVSDHQGTDRGWILDRVTIHAGSPPTLYVPWLSR